jgi:hypothetical protein
MLSVRRLDRKQRKQHEMLRKLLMPENSKGGGVK